MNNQEKADIKLAYQAAAELTYMIAIGLSQAKQKQRKKIRKFIPRQKNRG
jgi:hypothetical protein